MQMGALLAIWTPATPRGRPVRSPATEWGHFLNSLVAITPLMCSSHLLEQYTHSFFSDHIVAFVGSHGSLPVAWGGIALARLALKIDAAPNRKWTSIEARVVIPWARDLFDGGRASPPHCNDLYCRSSAIHHLSLAPTPSGHLRTLACGSQVPGMRISGVCVLVKVHVFARQPPVEWGNFFSTL